MEKPETLTELNAHTAMRKVLWIKWKEARAYTVASCAIWIGLALISVHQRVPASDGSKEYGWGVVFVMTALVLTLSVGAYQWGKGQE